MTESTDITPFFEFSDYEVSPLAPIDGPELQSLFERDPQYFQAVHGHPPGPSEAQSTYVALPEGKEYEDKFLLGLFRDTHLLGVVDIIRDCPHRGSWLLGLLFLDPEIRNCGVSFDLVRHLELWIGKLGGDELRVSTAQQNEEALRFFSQLGYRIIAETPDVEMGLYRNVVVEMAHQIHHA